MPILADTLIAEESTEYQVVKRDPNQQNYRDRVQLFVREHQNHVTIRRLKIKNRSRQPTLPHWKLSCLHWMARFPKMNTRKFMARNRWGN